MSDFDPDQLPVGPLSMSALVALEPAALRRLLKGGLRLGLTPQALEQLLRDDLQITPHTPEADRLFQALEHRGWWRWDASTGCWRTRLG